LSPRTRTLPMWQGLRAWLAGGGGPSPALSEWDGELCELGAAWRDEERWGDLRGLELLRRATGLALLLDDVHAGVPALVPRRGRDPRSALEGQFGVPDLEDLAELADRGAPAALRARVHDLRWTLMRDTEAAAAAQRAYLELARGADVGRAAQAAAAGDALLRAVRLSQERDDPSGIEIGLAEFLPRALHSEHAVALHRFLQAALLVAGPSRSTLADLAIARAETEIARRDFRWGRTFYGHAERALAGAGREHEAQTLGIVRASVLSDEARFLRNLGGPPWIAASFAQRAIDELRLVPGSAELVGDLLREAGLGNGRLAGPPGVEAEGGRFATALEELQRANDELDPRLRARLLAALPIEPESAGRLPAGPAVLDQFLRRFRARARGRFHVLTIESDMPVASPDAAHVTAWIQAARGWLVPLIDALRHHDARGTRERRAALGHLFGDSSSEFVARREVLTQGALACWDGDPVGGLGVLVPQLALLRASAPVHRLLERSGPLALVDAALLHHPDGFALAAVADNGVGSRVRYSQAAADLVLWWTLCLASLVEDP
jgi:hypothetical protein